MGGGGLAFWDAVPLECMFFLPEMQCDQVNHVFKFLFPLFVCTALSSLFQFPVLVSIFRGCGIFVLLFVCSVNQQCFAILRIQFCFVLFRFSSLIHFQHKRYCKGCIRSPTCDLMNLFDLQYWLGVKVWFFKFIFGGGGGGGGRVSLLMPVWILTICWERCLISSLLLFKLWWFS